MTMARKLISFWLNVIILCNQTGFQTPVRAGRDYEDQEGRREVVGREVGKGGPKYILKVWRLRWLNAIKFYSQIQMKFVVRQLVCFLLCVTLAVLGYEIATANCGHYHQENYSDIGQAFFGHLNATSEVLNLAVQNTLANKWMEFGLIRKFSDLFHHRIYWLVAALLFLICYYKFRTQIIQQKTLAAHTKLTEEEFAEHKKSTTEAELEKLESSEAYKTFLKQKEGESGSAEGQTEDEDFTKDWQQNQAAIFSD